MKPICSLLLLLPLSTLAQAPTQLPAQTTAPVPATDFVLRGRVLDAETGQGIPNAQIGLAQNRLGTSTNDEGGFVLRVPAAYATAELEVALLGYQRFRRSLAGLGAGSPPLLVRLRLSPAALGEVTVSASALGLVREAVARIPQNYPVRPTRLTGFLREADRTAAGKVLFVAEATEQVLVPSYTDAAAPGQVRLEQSRKMDLRRGQTDLLPLNWAAGPFVPLRFDFVRRRPSFLQARQFKNYTYRVADLTTFRGEEVYVIAFRPVAGREDGRYAGRLYVAATSYAFLGGEARRLGAGGATLGPDNEAGTTNLAATDTTQAERGFRRSWRVRYQPYAGRWVLKEVRYEVRLKRGEDLIHTADFLTTGVDTAQTKGFNYVERTQYEDVFLQNSVAYDSAFWRTYVPPLAGAAVRQALAAPPALDSVPATIATIARPDRLAAARFEQAQAAAATVRPLSPAQRLAQGLRRRLSLSYALGTVGVQAGAATTRLRFAPGGGFAAEGQTVTTASQRFPLLRAFGYQLDLWPRCLYLRYATLGGSGQYGADQGGGQLGLGLNLNLRPRHRPLLLRLGLDHLNLTLGREVGTFDNPDRGLRLAGTRLRAERLAVAVQTRTRAWAPRLGLGLELSHQTQLFLDASYLLDPRTATELSLRETSGFLFSRSDARTGLGDQAGATLHVNNAPATVLPWQPQRLLLQVGLVRRLR